MGSAMSQLTTRRETALRLVPRSRSGSNETAAMPLASASPRSCRPSIKRAPSSRPPATLAKAIATSGAGSRTPSGCLAGNWSHPVHSRKTESARNVAVVMSEGAWDLGDTSLKRQRSDTSLKRQRSDTSLKLGQRVPARQKIRTAHGLLAGNLRRLGGFERQNA